MAKLILEKINSNKDRIKIVEENIDRLQTMLDMTTVISRVSDVEKNFATMQKKIEKQISNITTINKEDIKETKKALQNELEVKDSLIKNIDSKIHAIETKLNTTEGIGSYANTDEIKETMDELKNEMDNKDSSIKNIELKLNDLESKLTTTEGIGSYALRAQPKKDLSVIMTMLMNFKLKC